MTGPGSGIVVLRAIAEDDWPAVHAWASQERVCRYQAWGPNTPAQTREFVRGAATAWTCVPRTRLVYAITLEGYVVGVQPPRTRTLLVIECTGTVAILAAGTEVGAC